ncbi:CPBP family intramembrane glutamic endopeptidase [Desmospora activa]|uniref:CAAX prenyl protease-like protein n=1 Tax=Desmospora activa DSM 45169 TaxID=1121389 RepID=A0A2T4Z4Y0_9BACL|nr:type II CAAX endopeptidase family protein [Desmospora activa]PTM56954.1 CAAX prenyl protease-like protein [Desmospora activa DSM 45169]
MLPAQSTTAESHSQPPLAQLRHWCAWFLCISFFYMVPMELSTLEWQKTEEGLWRIQSAETPSLWIAFQYLLWMIVTFISSLLFILTGSVQNFAYEKFAFQKQVEGLTVVYYFAWVQFLTMVTLFPYFFISGFGGLEWLDSFFSFLPHFIMVGTALVLFRGSWEALGFDRPRASRWLMMIGVVAGSYLLVFFFLDSLVTEPVARWFNLELASWREDDISAGISQAVESGWVFVLFQLLIIGVVGPIAEEVVFRGLLMKLMWRKIGVGLSILLSSVIFALFHADVAFFAPLLAMGLVMGILYAWFRSLWAPILFHIVNNSVSVLFEVFGF